jgi:hypothetical protein
MTRLSFSSLRLLNRRAILLWVGLGAVFILGLFVALSSWRHRQQDQQLEYWVSVAFAAQQAAVDRGATGDPTIGWPGDVQSTSTAAYLKMMETSHYFPASDGERDSMHMANVKESDPEDTVFVWGQWGSRRWIVRKNCRGSIEEDISTPLPKPLPLAAPPILPP